MNIGDKEDVLERCAKSLFQHIFFKILSDKYSWELVDEKVREGFRQEVKVIFKELNYGK